MNAKICFGVKQEGAQFFHHAWVVVPEINKGNPEIADGYAIMRRNAPLMDESFLDSHASFADSSSVHAKAPHGNSLETKG